MTAAVNVVHLAYGKQRAVCQFCGRQTSPTRPSRPDGRLSIFDVPQGWSAAPYPEGYVHEDGSTGTMWACPHCNRRLDRGESLYSRSEPGPATRTADHTAAAAADGGAEGRPRVR